MLFVGLLCLVMLLKKALLMGHGAIGLFLLNTQQDLVKALTMYVVSIDLFMVVFYVKTSSQQESLF